MDDGLEDKVCGQTTRTRYGADDRFERFPAFLQRDRAQLSYREFGAIKILLFLEVLTSRRSTGTWFFFFFLYQSTAQGGRVQAAQKEGTRISRSDIGLGESRRCRRGRGRSPCAGRRSVLDVFLIIYLQHGVLAWLGRIRRLRGGQSIVTSSRRRDDTFGPIQICPVFSLKCCWKWAGWPGFLAAKWPRSPTLPHRLQK